jgi:G3E family GTPase
MFQSDFSHAPLTVLADPLRLKGVLTGNRGDLSKYTAYIYRMQLEEADIIAVNKIDETGDELLDELKTLLSGELGQARIRFMSSRMGAGIDGWLEEVLSAEGPEPRKIDVDYDIYTEGELSLGWFNGDYRLAKTDPKVSWPTYCRRLLAILQESLVEKRRSIGHLKLLLSTTEGFISGSVTDHSHGPAIRGGEGVEAEIAGLVLNGRAETTPEELETIVENAFSVADSEGVRRDTRRIYSKRPGKPEPQYRFG